MSDDLLSKQSINLILHGVDTVSRITLNGYPLGNTTNMFVRYAFDVKALLALKNNKLQIEIESPVAYARRKSDDYLSSRFYIVPPFCPTEVQNGECHPNFIRKMQSSFSWDWGPALPSLGVWKSIELEGTDSVHLRNILSHTTYSFRDRRWSLNTTVVIEPILRQPNYPVTIDVQLQNYRLAYFNYTLVQAADGLYKLRITTPVKVPFPIRMWWPNGAKSAFRDSYGRIFTRELGRTLYNLTVTVSHQHNPQLTTSKSVRVGFRTLELVQKPVNPDGATFYFKVNGVATFMKGANWIPANVLPERVTDDYVRQLLTSAANANMNMLRVWGGGVYESDYFYDLADELGIFIWQDFMFAVALYPVDDAFLATVSDEIVQQVRRLQHHASIAVWAGNNENEAGIAQRWWPEIVFKQQQYKQDYIKLYIDTIKPIVEREDPSRVYLSSSPSNGIDTVKEGWIASDPQSPLFGDVHFYDYTDNGWDWTIFPSARFASEYGFQSLPSVSTWLTAVAENSLKYPFGDEVNHRQHSLPGSLGMAVLLERNLRPPAFGERERFADFVYLSQVSQAVAIKTETEFYRRNRAIDQSGKGLTMGALYWQLNDVWAAPTWASIEFGGKWKMLHYYARNMFAPVISVPYVDNGFVNVDIVNDILNDLSVTVNVMVYKWATQQPTLTKPVTSQVVRGSVRRALNLPLSDLLESAGCQDSTECVVRTVTSITNSSANNNHDNYLLLAAPRDLSGIITANITLANISVALGHDRRSNRVGTRNSNIDVGSRVDAPLPVYTMVLEANAISLFVWLDFVPSANITGEFDDNGFIMFEAVKTVHFTPSNANVTKEEIASSLLIRSLTDVVSF